MVGYVAMIRAAAAFLAVGGLVGCSEYLDRKNTIAFSAGNAVQTNIITHVPDPWPVHARNKNIAFDGERMQRAVERYRCGPVAGGGASGGGNANGGASAPAGGGAQEAC